MLTFEINFSFIWCCVFLCVKISCGIWNKLLCQVNMILCFVCSWDNFLWKINSNGIFKIAKLHQIENPLNFEEFSISFRLKEGKKCDGKLFNGILHFFSCSLMFHTLLQTLFDLYFPLSVRKKDFEFIYNIRCTFCMSAFVDIKECTIDVLFI